MQRREFLRSQGVTAALLAWQRVFAAAVPDTPIIAPEWQAPDGVFSLGVASGEPRPDSVVLWTRLAPAPLQANGGMPGQAVRVRWQVALDADFRQVLQSGQVLTGPERAHSVHAEVSGLPSDARLHYRFEAGGRFSPVGRTRTAPPLGARTHRLRVGVASCQHYEMGFYGAHREMAASDLDLVVFLGDYLYEGRAPGSLRVRRHALHSSDPFTLAQYRMHYGQYKQDPDLQANHAAHPWLIIPDDHEVRNDYDGDHDADGLSREAFLRVRADAYQAWFEHQPISPTRAPVGPDALLHAQYPWGDLVDLWMLDVRQFKSGPACEDVLHAPWGGRLLWGCDKASEPQRTMMGRAQEAWLGATLAESRSAWRLVCQGTQMAPSGFGLPGSGPLQYADGWDAFPQARQRFLSHLHRAGVADVVVVSGDVHRHVAANLRLRPLDPSSPVVASEVVTSSVSSRGLSEVMTTWMKRSNPDVLHARSDERGYCRLEIVPERVVCEFRAVATGAAATEALHTQATRTIERGKPGWRST